MKRLLALFICMPCFAAVEMTVNAYKKQVVPLLIGLIQPSPLLQEVAALMQKDFSFTGQFKVTVKSLDKIPAKKDLKSLGGDALFALFVTEHSNQFELRLYDTISESMVAAKKYKKRGDQVRGWTHNMADMVWTLLTGDEGFFSTKIAYCKKEQVGKREVKHVCIADYDGSNVQVLVDTPTINVAPRWNGDYKKPLLFYSDFTNTNVRLMVSDLAKHRSIASDFDGVNMIPAFSKDGKKIVYCLSRGDGSCQLYYYARGSFKQITHNNGNNVSPSLADDGQTVYFCSDFQTGKPQIYSYSMAEDKLERITDGTGYCAAPRYCARSQKLSYSRIVDGLMQLFVCDLKTNTHTQLTFDAGHKEESSWSPCGTKVLYSIEEKGKTRIAMMSLLSNEKHFLTTMDAHCSYPDWSPVYDQYPVLLKG